MQDQHQNLVSNFFIETTVKLWKGSSRPLFDYQNQSKIDSKTYSIPLFSSMFQKFIILQCPHQPFLSTTKPKLIVIHHNPIVLPQQIATHCQRMVASSICYKFNHFSKQGAKGLLFTQKCQYLEVNDKIYFGTVKYFVTEIKVGNKMSRSNNSSLQKSIKMVKNNGEDLSCRICYDMQNSKFNPLIQSPCYCTGSCSFVHIKCLKDWVKIRLKNKIESDYIITSRIQCEICRGKLPIRISIEGKMHQIVQIPNPTESQYIRLLQIGSQMEEQLITIKRIPSEGVTFGRESTCFFKIKDATVSRLHAHICFKNGQFVIFDNNSRFGTLVEQDNELKFDLGKMPRSIQIENMLVSLQIKKKIEEQKKQSI